MHLSPSGSYLLDSRAGVRIRQPIKAAREEFIKMMYVATRARFTVRQQQFHTWIMELRNKNSCQRMFLLKPRPRRASELMMKHEQAT
jgi:hypothetical protein